VWGGGGSWREWGRAGRRGGELWMGGEERTGEGCMGLLAGGAARAGGPLTGTSGRGLSRRCGGAAYRRPRSCRLPGCCVDRVGRRASAVTQGAGLAARENGEPYGAPRAGWCTWCPASPWGPRSCMRWGCMRWGTVHSAWQLGAGCPLRGPARGEHSALPPVHYISPCSPPVSASLDWHLEGSPYGHRRGLEG
jgi:hypothetical protein